MGFVYVFQVLSYEVIPLIGLKYANRVRQGYPRILNWSATGAPRAIEVEKVFLDSNVSTFYYLKIIRIQLYTL